MIKVDELLIEPVTIDMAGELRYTMILLTQYWPDRVARYYVEGTVMQLHGTMTVIVCLDLHVC